LMYSTGLTLITSVLASVVPPSILMVVAAATAGVSVGKALIGGLVPGVIMAIAFMFCNYFYSKKNKIGAPVIFDLRVFIKELKGAIPALLIPVILPGGILSGFFTPTEAAAVAVLYSLIIPIFVYKIISIKQMPNMFYRTTNMT